MNVIDLTGRRFGKLTVINRGVSATSPSRKHVTWECICDCGCVVTVRGGSLVNELTKSCGCLHKYAGIKRRTSRFYNRKEYSVWAKMKQRCLDTSDVDYKNYGGRGVIVCDRWLNSFDNFFEDMGVRPSNIHSIDRIDVNGSYCKENCRWVTIDVQARNKRTNNYIEFNGQKKVLSDWARSIGITPSSLYERLSKYSVSVSLTSQKGMINVS